MTAKVLVFVLALHMLTLLIEGQPVGTFMEKLANFPPHRIHNLVTCSEKLQSEIRISQRETLKLENPCKLKMKEDILIENSLILVEGILNLIAKNVTLIDNTIYGSNQVIRIIADNVLLRNNKFVGENVTYETVGKIVFSSFNSYVADKFSYKVMGGYIDQYLDKYSGNHQHHNLTAVDLKQVREEYSQDFLINNDVGLEIGHSDSAIFEDSYSVVRDSCIFEGAYQEHYLTANFITEERNNFEYVNVTQMETGIKSEGNKNHNRDANYGVKKVKKIIGKTD